MKNNKSFLVFARLGLISSVLAMSAYLHAETDPNALEMGEIAPLPEVMEPLDTFEAADINKDGLLSLNEYQGLRAAQSLMMLEEVYMAMDANKDGAVSYEEALSAKEGMKITANMIQKAIALDGQVEELSLEELEVLQFLTDKERMISRRFKKIDLDANQQVDLGELENSKRRDTQEKPSLLSMLEKKQAKLKQLKEKLADTTKPRMQKRLQRQISKLEKSIKKLQQKVNPSSHHENAELDELLKYEKLFNQVVSSKDYEFTYRSQISILRETVLRISVRGNKVTQVIDLNAPQYGQPEGMIKENDVTAVVAVQLSGKLPVSEGTTIDGLFAGLKRDLVNPDLDVRVSYDGKYGYPVSISTSLVDPNVMDGHSSYRISDFVMQ